MADHSGASFHGEPILTESWDGEYDFVMEHYKNKVKTYADRWLESDALEDLKGSIGSGIGSDFLGSLEREGGWRIVGCGITWTIFIENEGKGSLFLDYYSHLSIHRRIPDMQHSSASS